MAALAENKFTLLFAGAPLSKGTYQVKASTTIYGQAGVCLEAADGYARPCAASLTNPEFLGFALEKVVNSGASGAKNVELQNKGVLIALLADVAGAAGVTDIGATVYMSTDNDLTLTSTNNVPIGKVVTYVDGYLYIYFEANALASL